MFIYICHFNLTLKVSMNLEVLPDLRYKQTSYALELNKELHNSASWKIVKAHFMRIKMFWKFWQRNGMFLSNWQSLILQRWDIKLFLIPQNIVIIIKILDVFCQFNKFPKSLKKYHGCVQTWTEEWKHRCKFLLILMKPHKMKPPFRS